MMSALSGRGLLYFERVQFAWVSTPRLAVDLLSTDTVRAQNILTVETGFPGRVAADGSTSTSCSTGAISELGCGFVDSRIIW